MKEAIVDPEITVKIVDSPVPKPGPGEVLIKVVVSGINPKDWKVPMWTQRAANSGDDIADTVASLGANVQGLHEGDRVAAFHVIGAPAGSFAEYAIAPQHTVFPIPESISFEEAATVPPAAYTAAIALFHDLEFASPWDQASKQATKEATKRALVVYGASTAVGSYAIKLAQFAGIHSIIAVSSKNSDFVVPFLNSRKGDSIVDYTAYKTDGELVDAIKGAIKEAGVGNGRVHNILDCVSELRTATLLTKVAAGAPDESNHNPRLALVLPGVDLSNIDLSVEVVQTIASLVHEKAEEDQLFGLIWGQVFARGLGEHWLTPHPYEVAKRGLDGLQEALKGLKEGTVRGKKMVIRIGETEGV